MGGEFERKGAGVQLGPALNLMRLPWDGRNFEYLSGEDPYLGAELAIKAVRGIQSNKVLANIKHFIANNQESYRNSYSANVDERTLWEVYYPPFEASVKAGAGSAMCSYN